MGFIRIDPMRTKVQKSSLSYLLGLAEIRRFQARTTAIDQMKPLSKLDFQRRFAQSHLEQPPGVSLSQSRFMNRQSLYLRPDPARVVVRPFKTGD